MKEEKILSEISKIIKEAIDKKKRKQKDAEFQELKNEVGEIKELLTKLVEKL